MAKYLNIGYDITDKMNLLEFFFIQENMTEVIDKDPSIEMLAGKISKNIGEILAQVFRT